MGHIPLSDGKRGKEKKKKEKKKGEKKNFVNLRRQRRQRRADFSNRYESPELTGERAGFILFHAPTTTTTTPSSLCLSPYPHFHKHIQLSRHGTARHGTARQPSHYYSPVKVALPQSTSPKWVSGAASTSSLRRYTHYRIKKQQADNMTGPSGRKISHLHTHTHTHTHTLTHSHTRRTRLLHKPYFHSTKSQLKSRTFRFSRTLQLTVTSLWVYWSRRTRARCPAGRTTGREWEKSPKAFTFLLFLLL